MMYGKRNFRFQLDVEGDVRWRNSLHRHDVHGMRSPHIKALGSSLFGFPILQAQATALWCRLLGPSYLVGFRVCRRASGTGPTKFDPSDPHSKDLSLPDLEQNCSEAPTKTSESHKSEVGLVQAYVVADDVEGAATWLWNFSMSMLLQKLDLMAPGSAVRLCVD